MLLTKLYSHAKTNVVIVRGIKNLWELKTVTTSSSSMIQDVDTSLKALEIVYRTNGDEVEGFAGGNVHRKKVVGEGKVSVGEVHGPKVRGVSEK